MPATPVLEREPGPIVNGTNRKRPINEPSPDGKLEDGPLLGDTAVELGAGDAAPSYPATKLVINGHARGDEAVTPTDLHTEAVHPTIPLIGDEDVGLQEHIAIENEGHLSSDCSHPSLVDLVAHDDMLNFDKYVAAGTIGSEKLRKKVLLRETSDGYDLTPVTSPGTPNGSSKSRHSSARAMRQQSRSSRDTLNDPENRSVYSLYMEKDFRYYFQHPYFRLAIAYLVIFCNFLIYAEDPVAQSEAECFIPVVGNCFAFVFTKYPGNGWVVVKVGVWLLAILFGLVVGKIIIHKLLFNRTLKLQMFLDDQGSWMTMFFSVLFFVFLFSYVYNLILLVEGEASEQWRITEYMGIKNSFFMKAAASGTWCGDLFTAWMVTDVMMQVDLYPNWAPRMRRWWNHGWNRIILFWTTIIVTSVVVICVISTDVISWDRLNHDFLATDEVSRAFMASFILVMDLFIVMQDWDFPHFSNCFDIKLPGVNTAHIKFTIPQCLRKDEWVVHITGKWFNYGIIFFVMILDMNMWKNQIFYDPPLFAQYVGPLDKVHSVMDQWSLDHENKTMVYDFYWRNSTSELY